MDALLGAIEARIRPPRRRWPLVVGAAVVVAIAIAAGIFFARRGGDAPTASCDDARAKLARVWDDERKERVRATLSAGGTETHINTAARVVNILDEYTDRWVESYDGACRATHIDRTQPAEQLEIRTACYEGLRRKLAALTDILSEKDDVLVMSAVRVAAAMPAVDECEHATGNAIDPRAATPLVDEAIVLIERAKALSNVGRIEHAVESAVHAVAIARRTEHDPTLAEALLLLGALYMDIDGIGPSQRSLEEAVEVAERAGAHQIRANAATGLAYFHGVYVIRPQLAAKWTAIAEDALSKLPADNAEVETTRARLALSSAYTAVWNGDYEAAQALLQRAIDTFTGEHRNDLDGLMSVHAAAGEMAWELGMYRTASEHHEQCVQIAQTAYGADNPYTDVRRVELARMLAMSGELDRAAALVEPAHARLRAIYETHSEVAGAWLTLGIVRRLQKRFDEARDAIATAVEMSIDIHGAGSIPTADAFAALADVHLDAGQLDAAFEAADRAHAIRLAALGPEHLWVGESKLDLGMIALAKNELDRADELLGTALEISLEELGVDHYFIAIIRATRAQVQLARGERAAALEVMRAARAVIADSESPPEYLTKLDIVIASADPD
jgi:tetratricopeptide (TPR) repeat protein